MALSSGVLLAALQFFFALTWVVYVIYLPALASQAGLPKEAVPLILLADQAIFVICDWAAGVYADRVSATVGRLGPRIALVTMVSCAAFLALPFLAPEGSVTLFLAVTFLWSATSSALRAPPLSLMGRHASASQRPWFAGLFLFGVGAAGAVAPYLGSALKGVDPRVPFIVSSVAVALVTLVFAYAERRWQAEGGMVARQWRFREASGWIVLLFAAAIALFAVGFQVHFSVNSAPAYLRFAKPSDLEYLMPVFWIGFNLLMLPATLLAKRFGGIAVMAGAGLVGAAASLAGAQATGLETLVAAQFIAGGAWGTALMAAFTAALQVGTPNREGSVTGLLFSMLSLAAFARIAFVTAEGPKMANVMDLLASVPAVLWLAGAMLVAATGMARSFTRNR